MVSLFHTASVMAVVVLGLGLAIIMTTPFLPR